MNRTNRREFLTVGAVAGMGLNLADVLRMESARAEQKHYDFIEAKAKSVIHIYLPGGAAQQELWDPKPFAPIDYRGDLKPIKKFTNRKTGVARIWSAIQKLEAPVTRQAAEFAPKAKRSRKGATAENGAPAARDVSKKAIVLDMLKRPAGATLADIMAATDWQKHSVRGFISGALGKKMGLIVESTKTESGDRVYRIATK